MKTTLSRWAPMALTLAALCAPAESAILISNLSNPVGGFQTVTSANSLGQAFTVATGFDATITGATLKLNPFTAANLNDSALRLVDALTGAVLGTFTRNTTFTTAGFLDYSYTLSTPVTLTSDSVGAIVLSTSTASFRWSDPATTTNTSNGLTHAYQFFGAAPAPTSFQRPTRMLSYSIEGTLSPAASSVPEPGTLTLLGSCLATLAFLRRRR